jgi:hypothetical protein
LAVSLLRSMITVIATEEDMRRSIPPDEAEAQLGYDEWREEHWPFLNDMYLLVMVAIWHATERALIRMAAQVGDPASKISADEYHAAVTTMAKPSKRTQRLVTALSLTKYPHWRKLDTLRLLANCYKHDPFKRPQEDLLKALGLDHTLNYAGLHESSKLCAGFCSLLKLGPETQYKHVASSYLDIAERFLKEVRARAPLRPLNAAKGTLRADRALR